MKRIIVVQQGTVYRASVAPDGYAKMVDTVPVLTAVGATEAIAVANLVSQLESVIRFHQERKRALHATLVNLDTLLSDCLTRAPTEES